MVAFERQAKAMLMDWSVKLPYMRKLSAPICHLLPDPSDWLRSISVRKGDTAMTKPFYVGCKAFALEIKYLWTARQL